MISQGAENTWVPAQESGFVVPADTSESRPLHRLLELRPGGLYCPLGDFWIDPWRAVERAIVTHAHTDHAYSGSRSYATASDGAELLRLRLNPEAEIVGYAYGETFVLNGVQISLHPAGHMLGSSQVRIEHDEEVVVVSGDYKLAEDPTCATFTPLKCDVFISEATFGLPIYRWPPVDKVIAELHDWWRGNQAAGRTSVLFTYAVGKAQRILASLDPSVGPIMLHGAVTRYLDAYTQAGVALPPTTPCEAASVKQAKGAALVVAPPSAAGTPWQRKLGPVSTAFASGWMLVRGRRRQRNVDRGFIISDHADWDGLNTAIRATEAQQVYLTHGQGEPLARWLREHGIAATALSRPPRTDDESDEASTTHHAEDDE